MGSVMVSMVGERRALERAADDRAHLLLPLGLDPLARGAHLARLLALGRGPQLEAAGVTDAASGWQRYRIA